MFFSKYSPTRYWIIILGSRKQGSTFSPLTFCFKYSNFIVADFKNVLMSASLKKSFLIMPIMLILISYMYSFQFRYPFKKISPAGFQK